MTGAQVDEHLSEEALYWGCKVVDGNWTAGTRFSSAAAALRQTGQLQEELWPYDSSRKDGVRIDPPASRRRTGIRPTSNRSQLASTTSSVRSTPADR